jgi:DNA-binding Lrp family transcriptional regulator
MDDVIFFEEDDAAIGLMTRKATPGPEIELVKDFANYIIGGFKRTRSKKTRLAVFFEPMLDVGFPDIVLAEYNPTIFKNWSPQRQILQIGDFKILHHLLQSGGADSREIQSKLGLDSKILLLTIERLLDAGLIRRYSQQWQAIKLDSTFGLKRLTAVEAKVRNNISVFQQAQSNRWFASESYVLFPATRVAKTAVERSQEYGVGMYIFSGKEFKQVKDSPTQLLPSCYGSWLFNEWIGRSLQLVH